MVNPRYLTRVKHSGNPRHFEWVNMYEKYPPQVPVAKVNVHNCLAGADVRAGLNAFYKSHGSHSSRPSQSVLTSYSLLPKN